MLRTPTTTTEIVEQLCLHLDLLIAAMQHTEDQPQLLADCVLLRRAIITAFSA
ncbi:MAG: hypothetical protein ACO3O3_08640 [Ilumatobacteraceae bacterium]